MQHKSLASSPALKGGASARQVLVTQVEAQYAEMLAEHLSLCNPKPEEIKENTEDAE